MATEREVVVFFDIGDTLLDHQDHWIAGARDTLAALRGRGVPLGIISNTGTLTRAELQAELPADFDLTAFDPFVVLSSEVGFEKPDRRIFEKALELASARVVAFCTESLEHCVAAQRAGLVALRLNPPAQSDIASVPNILQWASLIPNGAQ